MRRFTWSPSLTHTTVCCLLCFVKHTYLWLLLSSSHPVPSCPPPPSPTQLSVIMLPLLVSACFAPLVMGCVSDRMGGRRKPLVYVAGLIMIVCNIALAFNRAFGWLPYIGMLFGAVRHASVLCTPALVPLRVLMFRIHT